MDTVRGHYFRIMLEANDSREGHAYKKLCPGPLVPTPGYYLYFFFHNHNQILNPFSIISLRKEQNPILCMYFFFGVFYPPKRNNIVKYLFHQFQVIETPSAQHLISASRESCLLSHFIKFFFFFFWLLFAQSITAPQPKKRYRVTFKLQPMIR